MLKKSLKSWFILLKVVSLLTNLSYRINECGISSLKNP